MGKRTHKEVMKAILRILNDKNCVGLTIALEPSFCGGIDNCLKILEKLCQIFDLDLVSKSKELLEEATNQS